MKLSELQYDLPPELIAQHPVDPRDASRLLVLDRAADGCNHRMFREIGDLLRPGDALVLNDTRVIPARFFLRRATGGRIEGLFLHAVDDGWRLLLRPSGKLRVGERLQCEGADATLRLEEKFERGEWRARPEPAVGPVELLDRIGQPPLPPYIERAAGPRADDYDRYQTVYAQVAGAVAAPTAGLHFTPGLLERLAAAGVQQHYVTLHVGLGTFQPIAVDDLREHPMHAEWFSADVGTLAKLSEIRRAGGRLVAVGTTATRVLESLPARLGVDSDLAVDQTGWTDIFIYPPYAFRNVDALITNFHLPGSTLLALVMALAGEERIRAAYAEAIEQRYRFYSYGDAMLIL